ncbi:kxDL motif-containing protein 1 isoform X2 [Pteropus vampyrus]|uniref:KxDL motif-containing protein 1 n=1 Tax=Pteropus vampyrus TaxID=132908 RepID=A0A6P3QJ13_PTEVA|nr:kxDL motif-containing protein 1 isoform X2 [Pteropus vampyrus]
MLHQWGQQAAEEEEEMDPPDSASRVFCSRILSMVNVDDINAIILAQKNMLDRFEKTNEMLVNFNNLSSVRLQQMSERFLHHTKTLVEMKRDLDSIFRRIRMLKGKLARQHPEAFSLTDQFLGLLTQMSQRHPSWRMRMKTPSHPAPRPPSPPRNRAQAPVTPAPTLSLPPSALALRTCPMSSPTPLPSTAADRQTMRRCWASSPAPRRSKGSQGSGSTPHVSDVAEGNPASRWSALPPYSWAPWGIRGVEFLGVSFLLLPH